MNSRRPQIFLTVSFINSDPDIAIFLGWDHISLKKLSGCAVVEADSWCNSFFQVLQRKTEEAAMATKRLKELLEARKSSARDNSGMMNESRDTLSENWSSDFQIIPWSIHICSWQHIGSSYHRIFLVCQNLIILCLFTSCKWDRSKWAGKNSFFSFLIFFYLLFLYFKPSLITWVVSTEQWEIFTTLAWSWARSDGECAWSSLWIWKAKPSVCIFLFFIWATVSKVTTVVTFFLNCPVTSRRAKLAEELAVLKQVDEFASKGLSPPRGKNGFARYSLYFVWKRNRKLLSIFSWAFNCQQPCLCLSPYHLILSPRVCSMSPDARMARISSLENMLSISSNSLVAMASQLSEAEERERAFTNRGRWNQLRSMGEAKNLLQYMFNSVADARFIFYQNDFDFFLLQLCELNNNLCSVYLDSSKWMIKVMDSYFLLMNF